MSVFHNHILADTVNAIVAEDCAAFAEDSLAEGVLPAEGLFRDRTTYEGRPQGYFHDSLQTDTVGGLVGGFCESIVDDSISDIGVVKSDIFGNEIAIQKRTAGAH